MPVLPFFNKLSASGERSAGSLSGVGGSGENAGCSGVAPGSGGAGGISVATVSLSCTAGDTEGTAPTHSPAGRSKYQPAMRIIKAASPATTKTIFRIWQQSAYFMNPRSIDANRPMFGSTSGISLDVTPNHFARVAEYSSTDVVGIQLPRVPVSSGPPTCRIGIFP